MPGAGQSLGLKKEPVKRYSQLSQLTSHSILSISLGLNAPLSLSTITTPLNKRRLTPQVNPQP